MSGDSSLPGHNLKGWFCSICADFIKARGNLSQRLYFKEKIKEACQELAIAWEQACEWFRETVREIELAEKTELENIYNKFRFNNT